MNPGTPSLQATSLRTSRLVLEPLRVDHADAMVEVLSDHSLYDVTGGGPPTLDELVATYTRQTAGRSADGTEAWLNWVVVEAESGQPVGYVQATVTRGDSGELEADIAWVVGVVWQGHGLATEAAQAMLDFLVEGGVGSISAFIEPGHRASERVAQRLGMVQTTDSADGEIRWQAVTRRNWGEVAPPRPVSSNLQHPEPRSKPVSMRMSSLFLRTLRDDPVDAEVPSHRLLVRAGYIRRAAPGIYSWLPLGLRVLRKIEDIVRQEMDAMGAQEVRFPALLPREPYEASGRWAEYGNNVFRLKDRKGGDYLLGPTHEEMFTLLVKDLYSSYKDLPLSLYQIQTKYRDEPRPRAGILRGREFTMKDSYSFDVSEEGFLASYEAHRAAYIKIFDRLGLDYVIVAAMSGAMGGSASEEFLASAENGEDTYVRCTSCDYAANVEAVRVPVPDAIPYDDLPAAHAEQTPDTPTIETLVDHLNEKYPRDDRPWEAGDTLKNVLVVVAHPDGRREVLAIGVPGDRDVDLKRLGAQVEPAEIEAFDEAAFAKHPSLVKGYIGPGVLGEKNESGIRFLVDPRIVSGTRWVTGADRHGSHVLDLVAGRDFEAAGVIEAADVREGDPCPNCGSPLETARGIEMGHIFQLGDKYADALDLKVLDELGKLVTVTMGSYGVGISRAVGAIVENSHDELGIIWPREVSPADVHLVATGKDTDIAAAADRLAEQLDAAGLTVLYDDRPKVSPGVKFKDAELIGVPTIVVVGRGLVDGVVEVKDRASGERENVAVEEAVEHVVRVVRGG